MLNSVNVRNTKDSNKHSLTLSLAVNSVGDGQAVGGFTGSSRIPKYLRVVLEAAHTSGD